MQGRVEEDMKLKKKVDNILKSEPLLLKQYIYSLSESAWNTKLSYLGSVSAFCKWLKESKGIIEINAENLDTLLPMDIKAYMTELKYTKDKNGELKESSSSKQMKSWSALFSFFGFLADNRFIRENVVAKTKRPKNRDEASHEYLNKKQIKKLMKKVEETKSSTRSKKKRQLAIRNELLIKIFLTTGIRVEPLREINIEDIDFENKTVITINKGHKTKVYKLVDAVMEVIKEWLVERAKITGEDENNQTGPLFVSYDKTRLSYWTINNVVKDYTSMIGIDGGYSCHKLRHSYGTAVYMMTKDIEYTKDALGHASIATTQLYVNEIDKELDDMVANNLNSYVS